MPLSLFDWYSVYHARREYYLKRGHKSSDAVLLAAFDANKLVN